MAKYNFSLKQRIIHTLPSVPCEPHTCMVTVTGTSTLWPTSCGLEPTAVGQSVMTLPGNSHIPASHERFPMTGCRVRGESGICEGRTAVVVGDGNAVHMAKGCRLDAFLGFLRVEAS